MARSPDKELVETWSAEGRTYKQMAQGLGISERTFYHWLNRHDELVAAIIKGRYQYAAKVAACGSGEGLRMSGENIQTITYTRNGKEYSYNRHIPAEVNASCLILPRM